jgi:DNA-directed RNA polymerase specialized sigma24 family protein
MTTRTDALHHLTLDLDRRSSAPEGRRALRRFASHGIDVGTATTIGELVASCHDRHRAQGRDPATLLDGLLGLARSDPDAALCALVALRPALYRIAGRVSSPRPADDDAIAEVVAIAWAVVRELERSDPVTHFEVIGTTWTRARTTLRRHATHALHEEPISKRWDAPAAPSEPTDTVEPLLERAIAMGTLTRQDAELIALTRAGDASLEELALRLGVVRGTLLRRRSRAEAALHAGLRSDLRSR